MASVDASSSTVCPQHGLRYAPHTQTGCVLCRRQSSSAPPSGAGPWRHVIGIVVLAALGYFAYQRFWPHSAAAPTYDEAPIAQALEAVGDAEGKIVVVHVWATWCPVCRAGLPLMNRFVSKAPKDEIEFVMLSIDDSLEQVETFVRDNDFAFSATRILPWAPGELTGALADLGATYEDGIPYTAVFDKTGTLVAERTGELDPRWLMQSLRTAR